MLISPEGVYEQLRLALCAVRRMDSSPGDIVGTVLDLYTPWMDGATRAILIALINRRGVCDSAERFALCVAARNRHQVAHTLRNAGMPALQRLAGWVRVTFWLVESE